MMKVYEVEMGISFTKTLQVLAEDAESAEMIAECVFMATDAIKLSSADLEEFVAYATPADSEGDNSERPENGNFTRN